MPKNRKDSYTPEELNILKEIFENNTKNFILSNFNRSWQSIRLNAKKLGLKRNPEIIKKEMIQGGKRAPKRDDFWTTEEDNLLKEIYEHNSKDFIIQNFKSRTWKALRERANKLKLTRDRKQINKEIVEQNKKTVKARYDVEYSTQLPSMQKKSKQTNLEKRGVEYPTQSAEVRKKVKETVQKRYGVDNAFQSEKIKEKIEKTNVQRYGVKSPQQSPEIREKTKETCKDKYQVSNPFQLVDKVQEGMIKKYGKPFPQQVPEIKEKTVQTNIEKFGFPTPAQNSEIRKKISRILQTGEVREKKYNSLKKKGTLKLSDEQKDFYEYLKKIDQETLENQLHPVLKLVIDYYMPKYDLWVQYDGIYWHGKIRAESEFQSKNIEKTAKRDILQNITIPNLIRFWSDNVKEAIKNKTTEILIKDTIENKLNEITPSCHQFKKKNQYYTEDINNLPFNIDHLKATDFEYSSEEMSDEIVSFIERYEWLGEVGVYPKWCFTARLKDQLGGVVLINEPTAYSKILGDQTHTYEALIQRGASASWAPKNLGSKLIMFSCHWMVNNTCKRVFVGYADPRAHERGIIYQACNFDYLGDNFGVSKLFKHHSIPKPFSRQYFNRTSILKKWCRQNNIFMEKSWFKENGFKNLRAIPLEIIRAWREWGSKIISESETIEVPKKRKYALILGKDKREYKKLEKCRNYEPLPYPKDTLAHHDNTEKIPSTGKTRNRKNTTKNQFIIDNYEKKTRTEIAEALNETPRWVKRQLSLLTKQDKITRKNPYKPKEDLLNEDKWLPEIKERAISLRVNFLRSNKEICALLKKEFDFNLSPATLAFWFGKFKCHFPKKKEWLNKFLPEKTIINLLKEKYRRQDFVTYLKREYDVYISEDIISLHIRSLL